jgi:hypothetical protein
MLTRLLAALTLIGSTAVAPAAEPEKSPIAPRTVTLTQPGTVAEAAGELGKQAGIPVTVDPKLAAAKATAKFNKVPFWTALEALARQTDARIAVHDGGRRIALEPRGNSREASSVFGPFRTVARQVLIKFDLESGQIAYSVQLDAHWEPRFPVFRITSAPQVTKATDDRGTDLTPTAAKAFTQPTGAAHALEPVRLGGLTRDSRAITVLSGSYTVTAAEKMLAFRFDDLAGKLPAAAAPQEGVTATLRGITKDETTWVVEVELNYPPGQPHFESFEEAAWLTQNRLQLVPPGGGKAFAPDDHQILETGRRVVAVYRFKEDPGKGLANPKAKGWSLVYETPSPLVEFPVRFELTDIPLP